MTTTAPAKPSIVGVSDKEASFFTIKNLSPFIHKFGVKSEDLQKWNRKNLVDFLKNVVLEVSYKKQYDDAIDDVVTHYADRDEESSYEFYLERYTQFISDVYFNVAAVDGILARRKAGWNIFAYSFDHYNDAIWKENVPKRLRGSPHVNEYPYMFEVFALGFFDFDEKEKVVADVVQQSFISFVKTGVPKNSHADWHDVGNDENLKYLSISPEPKMKKNFYHKAAEFWHQMRDHGFDLIQLLPTRKVSHQAKDEL